MKKVISLTCLVGLISIGNAHAGVYGIPDKLINKIDSGRCANVSGIGNIKYLYKVGFSVGRDSDGNIMRFMPGEGSPEKLPFSGLMLAKGGKKIVTVVDCGGKMTATKKMTAPKTIIKKTKPKQLSASTSTHKQIKMKSVPLPMPIKKDIGKSKVGGKKVALRSLNEMTDVVNLTFYNHHLLNGGNKKEDGHGVNLNVHVRPLLVGKTKIGGYFEFTDGVSRMHEVNTDLQGQWDYSKIGGGLSTSTEIDEASDLDANIGLLYQETDGSMTKWMDWSHQTETQAQAQLRYENWKRRKAGKKLIPAQEIGMDLIWQLSADYTDSNGNTSPYDNSWLNLYYNIDIFDFYIDEANNWRLTPTLNLSGGYLWGPENGYTGAGVGWGLSYAGNEMVDFRPLHFRYMDGDWTLFNGVTIELTNMWYAWNASKAKVYHEKK